MVYFLKNIKTEERFFKFFFIIISCVCVYECMFDYVKRQRQTEMRGDIWVQACHGACVEMKGQWVTACWHPFLLLSFTWLWGTKLRSSGFCFRCLNLLSRLAGSEKSIWNNSRDCYSAAHHTKPFHVSCAAVSKIRVFFLRRGSWP